MFNDRERDRETGNLNLGVRSEEPSLGRFTSIDPLWEKFPGQSPYVYADNNPLRLTDPTGMQAFRIQYLASVDWLTNLGGWGSGGGGGALPLIVVGGGITYVTQHPEETVPFLMDVANNITHAFSNPIGFAGYKIASGIDAATAKEPSLSPNASRPVPPLAIVNADKHGGGKNSKHANEKAKASAEKALEDAKKAFNELDSKRNKSKEDNKLLDKLRKQVRHLKDKADWKGEEHSKANKR